MKIFLPFYETIKRVGSKTVTLNPGVALSDICNTIMRRLHNEFMHNFMGFSSCRVKLLRHAVDLLIDKTPIIATGFEEPPQEGMVFALEPKKELKKSVW